MDYSPPGSFGLWDFPGKHTGVGCHFFLQGLFLTQGWNQSLLDQQEMLPLLPLGRQGSPNLHY